MITPDEFMEHWQVSVNELAAILGVSAKTVYQWRVQTESGRPPDKNVLKQLHYVHVIWKAWLQTERDLPPHIREYFEIARDRLLEAEDLSKQEK